MRSADFGMEDTKSSAPATLFSTKPGDLSHSEMRPAPLIVISGPSGVGKTTLVDALLARKTLPLRRAVTATTRAPRPGEVPEVAYHFWTREQFRSALDRNEMIEWAEVHETDFYGTPRSEVDPYRKDGIGVILVIDVQGAGQVRARHPGDLLTLFIAPPKFEDLARRLEGRGELADSIRRRLHTAPQEIARENEFEHILVNADLAAATDALESVIRADFQRRGF